MTETSLPSLHAEDLLNILRHGLIVSWHSDHGKSVGTEIVRHYVDAAVQGGAQGLRLEGADHIRAVRKETILPIIGYVRGSYDDGADLITPSLTAVEETFAAGANIVAIDVTKRKRPDGSDGYRFFDEARAQFREPLWADCGNFRDGIRAAEAGADYVATTLSCFESTTGGDGPDLDLIHELSLSLTIPVIAEGRIMTPEHAMNALAAGAWSVVVGTAITRPSVMTHLFASCIKDVRERLHGA